VYSHEIDHGQLTRWTDGGSSDSERDKLPPSKLIRYPTFDSVNGNPRLISACLMEPPTQFTGPRPVLIDIHGGPESQAGPIVQPHHRLFRKRGITVLLPNVRGSAGYGKTFLDLDNTYRREDAVKDIGALLDWIKTQPTLDSTRIGVIGASYGGYMALATAVRYGNQLKCAVDMMGISNFVTFLKNTEDYRRDLRRTEYGDEREPRMREFLESISPSNHVDKITTPLLIYQGKNDPRVPVNESRQIVEKIRARGGQVWYIEAANEGHSLSKPLNVLYVGAAVVTFLEKYLLGPT
jgi:dipeptidyl aminopeptidase/acylaminoacyl peptidase